MECAKILISKISPIFLSKGVEWGKWEKGKTKNNTSYHESQESGRNREERMASCLPRQAFCFNFGWNSVVLFHLHSLPAAVAFVCICFDTVYQLGTTLIWTRLSYGLMWLRGRTVREREGKERASHWARWLPLSGHPGLINTPLIHIKVWWKDSPHAPADIQQPERM